MKDLKKKRNTFESLNTHYEGREIVLNVFEKGISSLPPIEGTGHPSDLALPLRIITPKQMLQRLPIAFVQVKAGNTCENLLSCIT